MIKNPYPSSEPIDGAPVWVRILQAAAIGLVAGLALHAIFSLVVLQGEGIGPHRAGPSECKKNPPSRDDVAPPADGTATSEVRWILEGIQVRR